MSATPESYFPAVTIELSLSDLIKRVSGVETPVLTASGAVVTFAVTDLDDNELSTGTAIATDDDWFLAVNTPATQGMYKFKATVTLGSITGKFVDRFNVQAF
jgi:hypothetical protein